MNKYFYAVALLLFTLCDTNGQAKDSTINGSLIRHGKSASILYSMNSEPLSTGSVENLH